MNKMPSDDPRIVEALEACRPGSEDVADPAMARLSAEMAASPELDDAYERLQRLDRSLADAFQDVPVPAGLADRILARLAESQAAPAEESDPVVVSQPNTVSPSASRRPRRWWLIAPLSAAAALLLVVGSVWMFRSAVVDTEALSERAITYFRGDDRSGGQPFDPNAVMPANLSKYPFSSAIPTDALAVESRLVRFLGQEGVAYDISAPGGISATLYVIQGHASPALPSRPQDVVPYTQGNMLVAAWQEDGNICVLVLEGDKAESEYKRLLGPAESGPWA